MVHTMFAQVRADQGPRNRRSPRHLIRGLLVIGARRARQEGLAYHRNWQVRARRMSRLVGGTLPSRLCKDQPTQPQQKTHKTGKKHSRATPAGELKRPGAAKKHLNSHKSAKRKRRLREVVTIGGKVARKYVKMMGGDA